MSWNELFFWLAILASALAIAQLGSSNINIGLYRDIFQREPNYKVREVIRVFPAFMAIMTILALFMALWAAINLVYGFAKGLALIIANHFHYLDNNILLLVTLVVLTLVFTYILFRILKGIWRLAARITHNQYEHQDVEGINRQIRLHLKDIREGKTKPKKRRS